MANIQGLRPNPSYSKTSFVRDLAITSNAAIITLSESHLSPDILDAEVAIPGFLSVRSDRVSRSHGGVITYISSSLSCRPIQNFSDNYCSLSIIYLMDSNLVIMNVYRPPDCPSQSFSEVVTKIRSAALDQPPPTPDIVLLGDFNLPRFTWPDGKITPGGSSDEQKQAKWLINLSLDLSLSQYILKPTRANNILDLAFTNNQQLFSHYTVTPTIFSDHDLVTLTMNYKTDCTSNPQPPPPSCPPLAAFDFHNADWSCVNSALQRIDWTNLFFDLGPISKFRVFMEKLEDVCNEHLNKRPSCSSKKKRIPRQCRKLYRNRSNITKNILQTNSPHRIYKLLQELQAVERNIKDLYKSDRQLDECRAIGAIKENPKFFFKYAKKYSKTKSEIGPLLDENQSPVHSSLEMANLLQQQFESVFSAPLMEKVIHSPDNFFINVDPSRAQLTDIDFSPSDFVEAIDRLRQDAAPGPDGVSAVLLKNCKKSLATPLYLLWRCSLDSGSIPGLMKSALVVPIHKGDSRAVPQNYRPISLTSHLTKVFERVLRDKLVRYLESNHLMNDHQHGFRPGKSCLTQLLEHYDAILDDLERGANVDVIYLDFAKAFDKVDHGVLCHKILSMNIGGRVGGWLHSFLVSRTQKVAVNFFHSSCSRVISGVPQGTVLGPILFLIYIADINQNISSRVSSFADDTRISRSILSVEDTALLQADLQAVYMWQEVNNMLFNEKKFELLRYGKNSTIKLNSHYTSPTGSTIVPRDHLRDLGIIMNNRATFGDQVDHLTSKAKNMSGWVLRTFMSRDRTVMLTLWRSMIQPIIDYCSQLWAPCRLNEKMQIESLQRAFTRQVLGMKEFTYWERLKQLNIYSQERRMERYRIIYTWKALEGFVPNFGVSEHLSPRLGRLCRIPKINTRAPLSIQTLRENSLLVDGPKLFNSMPKRVRCLSGCEIATFKHHLDAALSEILDEPRVQGQTQYCSRSTNSLKRLAGW